MAKIFPIAGYITLAIIEQMIPEVFKPDYSYYIFQTGIAGVLFFVWFITEKNSRKTQRELTENTAKQFAEIFKSMKDMQQGYLEQNSKTLDRMFSIMQEDIKYKALLAETISRFDTKLSNHINQ